ncbi:MAG: crotonobetaine/carnitine-CoA ligase [Coriobacteriia bacterium]|nr:crotonobetaine/carnitine-CoA ligase [Coriobacteriia bacterium]MCL2750037.1 crotonobetaine/carnitine-CoA ligase [Coriobacteriia bacterium]
MTDTVGNETIRSLWDNLAHTRGDHPFLVFHSRTGEVREYTYREFNDEINRTANLFLQLGVEAGEVVAVHMHTSPEFLMCLFGLTKIGAVMVPINEQYLQRECEYVLEKCSATCAVIEDQYLDIYESIMENEALLPKGIFPTSPQGEPRPHSFECIKDAQSAELTEVRPLDSSMLAEILFTSGTTSCPKGVMLTHANLIFSGHYGNWETNMNKDDRLLTTMPACHSNFQLAAMTPVLTAGATLIVVEKYSARNFWNQICSYRATVTQAVAMMVRTLLMQPVQADEKNHCLREVLYFLPLSNEEKLAFEERFATRILNTYGSTETIAWVITDPPVGERNWPSIGRVGLPYEAKVVDEDGKELPYGEIGDLMIKGVPGRTLMKGYYKDEQETARVLDAQGWLVTDDKGYQDESGWFYFVDRKANMIKRSGENISATEIEAILMDHPLIAEAAIIGIPDPIRDEAVKAFILLEEGATITTEEVLEFCALRMAPFKIPSVIEFVESFPRTCSLKIEKKLLKEQEQDQPGVQPRRCIDTK